MEAMTASSLTPVAQGRLPQCWPTWDGAGYLAALVVAGHRVRLVPRRGQEVACHLGPGLARTEPAGP